MKVKAFTALLGIAVILACASCKSTPTEDPLPPEPVEEPAPVEEPKEEPAPEPEPEPEPEPAPMEEPKDFSEANTELMAKLAEARDRAAAAGAKSAYPAEWKGAENDYAKLQADMAADPKADYSERIKDLTARYDAMDKASQALAMKKRADSLDSEDVDKTAYKAGEDALAKYGAEGDSASANAAYNAYKSVLDKAFRAMAGRARNAALGAKKNADSVKAGVSQKESYGQAADIFKKADSDYVTQNSEQACKEYQEAEKAFTKLYETVAARRAAAQAAIDRARQKADATASYASDADSIAPLGDAAVAGIEAEDAVLLEADELANPEEAVIDVSNAEAESEAQAAIAEEEAAAAAAKEAQ